MWQPILELPGIRGHPPSSFAFAHESTSLKGGLVTPSINYFVRNRISMGLIGMARNEIIPYNPGLRKFARALRKNSTLGEILFWKEISRKKLGVQFHRQVPVHEYIIDFYCHELKLAIEVDGASHDNPIQKEKDLIRDYNLEQLGITVIRIDDLDVKQNMDSVIRFLKYRIKEILCGKDK